MENEKLSKEEFNKQRDAAVKQIAELLNKYSLTIAVEHNITIIPQENIKK